MGKKIILTLSILTFLIPSVYARDVDDSAFYLGTGCSFAYEMFDYSEDYNADYGNTFGFYLKTGYRFNRYISFQIDFDYFRNFLDSKYSDCYYCSNYDPASRDFDILTLTGGLKLSVKLTNSLRPYVFAGAGIIKGKTDFESFAAAEISSQTVTDSGKCVKAAAGIDYFLSDNVSLGFEGGYTKAFGDLDEIKFAFGNINVAFYF
ncbi:MAG: porin family protein [Desulfobacterales bacterium]|nr:porin family protein [Desulfobacterales bacterium]